MLRKLVRALALIPLFWVVQAQAVGLGEIDVHSRLNQRFSATIPVVGASAEDLENLSVRLASAADFERNGVEQTSYLTSLGFSVDGSRVTVSSKQIAREPLLNFVVEARWRGGRLLREYTVFLDPPSEGAQAAPATAAAPAVAATPRAAEPAATATSATRGSTPAPAAAAAAAAESESAGGSSYGPTAPQETLWSIATKVRPGPGVTMDQVLLALYQANPGAFVGGLGGLQKGVTLSVPSAATMTATDADTAHAQVARLRSGRGLAPAAAAARAETPRAAATPKPPVAAAKPTPPVAAATTAPAPPTAASITAPAPSTPPPSSPSSASTTSTSGASPDLAPFGATPKSGAATAASPSAAGSASATPGPAPSASTATTAAGGASPAAAVPPTTAATPSSTPSAAPASGPAATPAAGTTAAAPSAATPSASGTATPATTPAATPPPAAAPVTTPAAAESHGLLEGWLIPLILVLVLLLLVGMVLWRRRDKPAEDLPPVKLTPKTNLSKPVLTGAAAGAAAAGVAAAAAPPLRNMPSLLDEPMLRSSALDTPPQTPAPGLPAGSRGGYGDFDRVAASDTKSVNVGGDSNDPLSEADFHLAYGLYDEAAALLKQAIARDPERSALRMKLAETYFAAGRPLEFQEVAEEMHNKLGPAEWNRVAGMGRQLAPGAALFAQSAAAPAATAPPLAPAQDLDFAFDLPSPTLKTTPAPQDHFVLPEMDVPAMAPPAAPAAAKSDSHIDFDLEQELLKEPAPASAPAPKPDLDLADFDLDGQAPKKLADVGTVEFNLDELDLSDAGSDGSVSGPGDEMGTKLDLARAYSDMGDNDAARGLLGEVVKGGSPSQKQEAEALLQRLSA